LDLSRLCGSFAFAFQQLGKLTERKSYQIVAAALNVIENRYKGIFSIFNYFKIDFCADTVAPTSKLKFEQ
jgi:fumarate hydratase class II